MTSGAPRRISVVGLSGSGKSSVARRAADLLDVTYVELDALHWNLPDWQMPPLDEFRARVDAATRRGGWVVDGNYGKVRDIVWTRADTVVWLDLPLLTTIWRITARTIRRMRRRKMLWGGNRERVSSALFGRDSLWLYNIRTFRRRRGTYAKVSDRTEFGATRLVRLRKQREIEDWLAGVTAESQR